MIIGKRIEEIRKLQGLSQSELAKLANTSQAFISGVEAGKKNPTVDTLESICSALGITLVQFFDNESPIEQELDPYLHKWIKVGESLTPDQRKSLLQTIDRLIDNPKMKG